MRTTHRRAGTLAACALLLGTGSVWTQNWPQWRGPNRDAVATGFTAPRTWPKELEKKWSIPVGQGVATPALVGNKLYAFGYQDGNEVTRCLDAATGKVLWKNEYEARSARGPAQGFPAARSSPAVAMGKVVTFGVQGTLSCLDADKGTVLWRKESTGGTPGFSTSCSPLLVDGLCVVQVGGDRGSQGAVAAYDLGDGKEKWKWSSDGTKYASPALLDLNGMKVVVVETAGTISALNVADGKLLWSTDFSTRYNASSPTVEGSVLYYAGSGQPTRAVKLERQGDKIAARELWSTPETSVMYNTPVIKDGLLFGLSQRNEIFCIDTQSGKKLWSHSLGGGGGGGGGGRRGGGRGGYGSIVAAGPVLFALTPAAQLVVFKPDREEFKQVASYKVANGGTYAYPIVTSEGVYIKDRDAVTFWTFK
jgi:outer membrane protein assembly factor BamB